jgi:formylglycine-generating enzyme required for sulfatase activity/tRNA A-37 threonylcarbamoyl transferase component Bud32
MAAVSVNDVVDALRQFRLLEPQQLAGLTNLASRFPEPRALARELLQRDWLTPYQVNQLLTGQAASLVLGQFVLLERLGEGGMGLVFKARQLRLNRLVALKVIRRDRLTNAEAVKRFQREILAAAQLSHPNVIAAYDADQAGDALFFAMEYVDGTDLSRMVKESGPLPVPLACDFIRQAAQGLQHAHSKGLVHRDIKPSNLLVAWGASRNARGPADGSTGRPLVKILDLGLARLHEPSEDASMLTQEGSVMGTIDFLAPEQAKDSHRADSRSDLYSLGCTFYFLLAGHVPFPGGMATERLLKHRLDEPVPVEKQRPDIPAGVAAIVRRMMAKKPEERFQSAAEVVAALTSGSAITITAGPGPQQAPIATAFRPASDTLMEQQAPGASARSDRRRLLWAGAAGAILTCLVVALLVWAFKGGPSKPTNSTAPEPFVARPINMRMALIPAGTFAMGSSPPEIDRVVAKGGWPGPQYIRTEGPAHEVTLSQPFYLGVHTVTRGQFRRFISETGYPMPRGAGVVSASGATANDPRAYWEQPGFDQTDDHPVVCVSWTDALEFIDWLNEKHPPAPPGAPAGQHWRYALPTEAQWEYACRAGSKTAFFWGDDEGALRGHANVADAAFAAKFPNSEWARRAVPWNDKFIWTAPQGTYSANAFGLHDMHGNVWQWCADRFDPTYYRLSPRQDPPGSESGGDRVIRGGSWRDSAACARSASRYGLNPGGRHDVVGFRVACVRSGLAYELKKHPANAVSFQGHWYAHFPEKITSWREAQRRCQELGGYLACPRTLAEHQFVLRLINRQNVWLGGYNDDKNRWYWITGERIGTFYWAQGQPNNGTNVVMQSGLGLPGSSGERTWHDVGRGADETRNPAGFVCVWDF